jgi:hypothetical protein
MTSGIPRKEKKPNRSVSSFILLPFFIILQLKMSGLTFVAVTFFIDKASAIVTLRDIQSSEGKELLPNEISVDDVVQAWWQPDSQFHRAIVRRISSILFLFFFFFFFSPSQQWTHSHS